MNPTKDERLIMKIGVMSDTHGNIDAMNEAARIMIEDQNVEAIIHLGDYFDDTEAIDAAEIQIYAVPGLFENAWNDPAIPRRKKIALGAATFLISHTSHRTGEDRPDDFDPMSPKDLSDVDAVLYGHTHVMSASRNDINGALYICPGHIKADVDRNMPASFCIIEVLPGELYVKFYGLDGEMLNHAHFSI